MANGSTNPAPTPRAEQTARNKQARINRPEQIGPGIALVARRWRSRTPFSPDAGQRALPPRVPTACRGRALARPRLRGRRSGPERRLRRAIVPGMPGPQHQATEAKPAQHVADAALGHHHPKVRLDRAHEVGPAPARHPIPRKLRALDDPAGYCLLLLSRQQAGGPATMPVAQAGQAVSVVAMHPVTQRLPVHAASSRSVRARRPVQHRRQSQHAAGRTRGATSCCRTTKPRRIQILSRNQDRRRYLLSPSNRQRANHRYRGRGNPLRVRAGRQAYEPQPWSSSGSSSWVTLGLMEFWIGQS